MARRRPRRLRGNAAITLTPLLLIPAGYQLVALAATLRWRFAPRPQAESLPPISILKPIRGTDPGFWDALRSHAELDYPDYEILFCIGEFDDPAIPEIQRLIAEYPGRPMRLIERTTEAPNRKVGSLIDLAREARHDVIVLNDGDIAVPRDYLRAIAAQLDVAGTGLVTALYRADGFHAPGKFEALGVSTDFTPSTLVAPFAGIEEFGMGSTLALTRETLEAAGGFEAIAGYIADDYQLGKNVYALGLRVALLPFAVSTSLNASTFRQAWEHQLRWARTVRVSRGGLVGYVGLPVTHATLWALIAALAGHPAAGAMLFALRLLCAVSAALAVGDRPALRRMWLLPLRDLWSTAVWMAGLVGHTVRWGPYLLRLTPDGRIER